MSKPSSTWPRLTPEHVGQTFTPWGTDSRGVVKSWGDKSVTFSYEHDPEVSYMMPSNEFTERFGRWVK